MYRLDDRTLNEVLADYASGMSGDQVAAKYAISRWIVYKLVRENGGTVRYKRLSPQERTTIAELCVRGMSQVDIATQIHRSPSLMWHALNAKGFYKSLGDPIAPASNDSGHPARRLR
jgi:Mor family transcriptional regulator